MLLLAVSTSLLYFHVYKYKRFFCFLDGKGWRSPENCMAAPARCHLRNWKVSIPQIIKCVRNNK